MISIRSVSASSAGVRRVVLTLRRAQLRARFQVCGNDDDRYAQTLQHDIVLAALRQLAYLPARGSIGLTVREDVTVYADVEVWKESTKSKIDRILSELKRQLESFLKSHPDFRETIALRLSSTAASLS